MSDPNMNEIDFVSAGLDEVKSWDGDSAPPPEGDYLVFVDSFERKKTEKGQMMLATQFKIISNADGTPSDYAERTLFGNYMEEGKGRGRLKQLLEATGTMVEGGYKPSALKGRQLIVTVTHEEFSKPNPDNPLETKTRTVARVGKERASAPVDNGTQTSKGGKSARK